MKKIIPALLSINVGVSSAIMLYKNVEINTLDTTNAKGLELGVFTKKKNAEEMKENLGGIVVEDDGVYRVYYGILNNENNIDTITSHLKNMGISYYIKDLTLSPKTKSKLDDLENSMLKNDNKLEINKNILKELEGEL